MKTGTFRPEWNPLTGFSLSYVSGRCVLFICVMQFEPILPRQELRLRLVLTRFSLCRLLQNHTRTTSFSRWRPLAMRAISCDDGLLFSTKLCSRASLAPRLQRQRHREVGADAPSCADPPPNPPRTWWLFSASSSARSCLFCRCTGLQVGDRDSRLLEGLGGLQAAVTPQNEVTSHALIEWPLTSFNPLSLWLTLFLVFDTSSVLWITTLLEKKNSMSYNLVAQHSVGAPDEVTW